MWNNDFPCLFVENDGERTSDVVLKSYFLNFNHFKKTKQQQKNTTSCKHRVIMLNKLA